MLARLGYGLAVLAGLGLVVAMAGLFAVILIFPSLPSLDPLTNYQLRIPLRIYTADDVLIGEFGEEWQGPGRRAPGRLFRRWRDRAASPLRLHWRIDGVYHTRLTQERAASTARMVYRGTSTTTRHGRFCLGRLLWVFWDGFLPCASPLGLG